MGKGRVEAFTDGVLAIVITIMVLELKVPHGDDLATLAPLWPVFFSYVLSFIYVGIYWNNLHNMFHTVQRVDGWVLWANLHLLFWLSLMPVTTAFMGENHFAPVPVAVYGVVLALCAAAYTILVIALHRLHGHETTFARAIGSDRKGRISLVLYIAAVLLTFFNHWIGVAIYVLVAMIWFVPDRRFERLIEKQK
ncbi:DUF1211 domain-containing protein [Mesorhizobium sp. M9A.F.Ca.ET.002.03.1.2]|uniref:TMEM175 family protein n=1 Tax=Mesorhizobium sp. M9A.F.Ca.ET.002.03.1.2 TaxID=2493668 RepID=UPI000F765041|nr:TMEM175 family protein [Mesorhizobium sp. M9A.F.Ca.ET.002.03.1.2]AZO00416.1 DUF1211 domain-containing protein [Mesorhizobium sp. M9A.F.Ca.ET.002.03.1.2]